MQQFSKTALMSGIVLLAWQGAATLIGLVGQADMLLAMLPDPVWLATFLAAVVAPPGWVTVLAIAAGAALVAWSVLQGNNSSSRPGQDS